MVKYAHFAEKSSRGGLEWKRKLLFTVGNRQQLRTISSLFNTFHKVNNPEHNKAATKSTRQQERLDQQKDEDRDKTNVNDSFKVADFQLFMGKGGVFSAEYEPAVCCSKLKIITISFHTFHFLLEKIQMRCLSSTLLFSQPDSF